MVRRGPAVSFANDNQLQIPRSARNDNANDDARGASDTDSATVARSHDESSTQPHATQAQALPAATHTRTPVLPEPAHLRATFDANPELHAAWRDASAYRESFATPDAARQATALLADVNHMDALFFSRRPEDHASLARAIANLDPAAFTSLANAMHREAANVAHLFRGEAVSPNSSHTSQLQIPRSARNDNVLADANANSAIAPHLQPRANESVGARHAVPERDAWHDAAHSPSAAIPSEASGLSSSADHAEQNQNRRQDAGATTANNAQSAANESQLAFLHAANAAAVEGVVAAIEAQVERLLPEGVAKNARTRVVGEIYRELDSSLRSNPQFAAQLRDAFRSGSLDDGHQRAIVSLLTGRARQALPGVAKRVLSEWTSTIVSAANERRTRQRTAERRIDIAGSSGAGNDGRRSMSPRDLDYARLSDADILNL